MPPPHRRHLRVSQDPIVVVKVEPADDSSSQYQISPMKVGCLDGNVPLTSNSVHTVKREPCKDSDFASVVTGAKSHSVGSCESRRVHLQKKQKRIIKAWSLEQKLAAVARVKAGESINGVARDIGAGAASVCEWKKWENQLREGHGTTRKHRKHVRLDIDEHMEDTVVARVKASESINNVACDNGASLTGVRKWKTWGSKLHEGRGTLRRHRKCIHKEGEDSLFIRHRLKKHHCVRLMSVEGETASTNTTAFRSFKEEFARECSEYSPEQVYNADETGLFWKKMPNKTFLAKEDMCPAGFKLSKERLSLLLCANAAGTDKLRPIVVGKAKCPRAFKHINVTHLPVLWRHNSKAQVVRMLFDDWFLYSFIPHVKEFLRSKNLAEKAVLVLDKATAHSDSMVDYDKNFKVIFLPPNLTALMQPMDLGIITDFKRLYTRRIFHRLAVVDDEPDAIRKYWQGYTLKEAMYDIGHAWVEVSQGCLKSVWKKLWPECNQLIDEDTLQQVSNKELAALANDVLGLMEEPLTANEMEEHIESHHEEPSAEDVDNLTIYSEEAGYEESTEVRCVTVAKLKEILSLFIQLQDKVADYDLCIERRVTTLKELRSIESHYYHAYCEKKTRTKISDFFAVRPPAFQPFLSTVTAPSTAPASSLAATP
uniref:DDE-1 domain-containing protein n=1 Tax=Eptatretus burgeri TaxID=7764 RepID=A0A8C4QMW9_EPTBU